MTILTFPASTPNFVNFDFPEYLKNVQEFKSTDYYQINYQTTNVGIIINAKYEKRSLTELNLIRTFYYQAGVASFNLSPELLKNFDLTIKQTVTTNPLWVFKEAVKINPFIINRQAKLYNFTFSLVNVLS